MRSRIIKTLEYHFHHPNYLYFLLSLLFLIFFPPIAELFEFGEILINLTFGLVVLMAAVYTPTDIWKSVILLVLGVGISWIFFMEEPPIWVRFFFSLGVVIFFSMIFWDLVKSVLKSKVIKGNDVFAAIAGYLVLGILAAPTFFLIKNAIPGSFNVSGSADFYDFLYFSYITLTSVGYGDFAPVHPIARSFAMVLGIIGQMYLTILVGIIIGKFLAADQSSLAE